MTVAVDAPSVTRIWLNAALHAVMRGEDRRSETDALGFCLIPVWRQAEADMLIAMADEAPLADICTSWTDLGYRLGEIEMLAFRGCVEASIPEPILTRRGFLVAERLLARRGVKGWNAATTRGLAA